MKNDVRTLQKKEGLVFLKTFIVFLFLSTSLYAQIDMDTPKEIAMKIPGVSQSASFYPVSFKNETERNLYLCISLSSYLDQPVLYVLISAGDYVKIELLEGAHNFAFMDLNWTHRGERDGGDLLRSSADSLSVVIDGKKHLFERTFSLDVIASDDQKISIEKNEDILHNSDKSDGEKNTGIFLLGFFVLVLIFIIGIALKV